MTWTIEQMFDLVISRGASDIIFVPGAAPVTWAAGRMRPLEMEPLGGPDVEAIFMPILTEEQRSRLAKVGDLDFSVGKTGVGRFRVNIHRQRGSLAAATRFIPHDVPTFNQLKLPPRVLEFADLPHGLVLVTGGAATGKSTTLAAMIEHMNRKYAYHIITLEDPIEFTFRHARSIVEQREVGVDCPTFASALRHVVRQRPDVIMVGEMRDLETISAALTAAEMGHLVLASLHTNTAVQTIDRIIDIFPASQQTQVRVQLSNTLEGVLCQGLFHDEIDGGMAPSAEIMICTRPIRRAIRDHETHLLEGMIETGRALGMQSMDTSIAELIKAGRIVRSEGLARAQNLDKVEKLVAA